MLPLNRKIPETPEELQSSWSSIGQIGPLMGYFLSDDVCYSVDVSVQAQRRSKLVVVGCFLSDDVCYSVDV